MNDHRLPALLAAALLLAACTSCTTEERPAAPGPAPVTAAPAAPTAPAAPAATGPTTGLLPPFTLPSLGLSGEMSLADALAKQKGKPLVLVLGAASCSVSTEQVEELAADGAAGPGAGEVAFLAVVQGSPAEVAGVTPAKAAFPVLLDGSGATLDLYRVGATPSVVVLDGAGRIAYIGAGGYIPVPQVREMAARAAKGEAIDPASVKPAAG